MFDLLKDVHVLDSGDEGSYDADLKFSKRAINQLIALIYLVHFHS